MRVRGTFLVGILLLAVLQLFILCPPRAYATSTNIVYQQSSFSYTKSPDFDYYDRWPRSEPVKYKIEKGQWGWINSVYYGGNMYLISDPADNSRACIKMVWDDNSHSGGNKMVKLYELQSSDSLHRGTLENYDIEPYISTKEAYYHFKVWFPANTSVTRWRLIFQICGEEGVFGAKNEAVNPQLAIDIFKKTSTKPDRLVVTNDGYYFSDGKDRIFDLMPLSELPKDQWVEFVVFYKQGSGFRVEDGTTIVWINSEQVFERHDLSTATKSGTPFIIWGIGLYGSPDEPYGQVQLFKDVKVTSSLIASTLYTALPWEDGFESGNFSAWSGTQVSDPSEAWATVTSTYAYQGFYSANFTTDGSDDSYAGAMHIVQNTSKVFQRSHVRLESLPDTNNSRLQLLRVATDSGSFIASTGVYNLSGSTYWSIDIAGGSTDPENYTQATINNETWYSIEFYFNATPNGNAALWVNDVLMCQVTGDYSSLGDIGRVYPYLYVEGAQPSAKTIYHDNYRVDNQRISQASVFFLAIGEQTPLENVKINGTRLTDSSGFCEWESLACNMVYTFVIERPAGYYQAWVLNVEGSYSWNGTHYILKHYVTETQTDPIEIYFSSTEEVYIKSSTHKLTSAFYSSSSQNPHTFMRFNITADIGATSRIEIYTADEGHPRPYKIEGATDWSYDSVNEILTVWMLHTGEEEAEIEWRGAAMGQ